MCGYGLSEVEAFIRIREAERDGRVLSRNRASVRDLREKGKGVEKEADR